MAQGKQIPEGVEQSISRDVDSGLYTKTEIAKRYGVSLRAVYDVLKRQHPDVARERRREALEDLQQQHVDMAKLALSLVTKEKLKKASGVQLMTMAGIASDKAEKFDRRITENEREEQGLDLLVPSDPVALLGAIRNDLRAFDPKLLAQLLRIKFEEAEALQQEVSQLEATLKGKLVDAEVRSINDFDQVHDGPGNKPGNE